MQTKCVVRSSVSRMAAARGAVSVKKHISQRDYEPKPRVAVRACPPKLFREGGTSGYPGLEVRFAFNLEDVACNTCNKDRPFLLGLNASLYYQEFKGRPYMGAVTYLSMKDEKDGEWTYSSNFFRPLTKSLLIRPVSAKDVELSIGHRPNKKNKRIMGVGIQVRSGSVYIKDIRKGKKWATASVTVTGPDGKAVSSVQKTLSSLGYG